MTTEVNKLIEKNMKLCYFVCNKLLKPIIPPAEKEECIGVAEEALCVAAIKYDRNIAEFSTYAVIRIRYAVLKYLYNHFKYVRHSVFVANTIKDIIDNRVVEDKTTDIIENINRKIEIEKIYEIANEEEKDICRFILEDYTFKEMESLLFKKSNTINQQFRRFKEKVKKTV